MLTSATVCNERRSTTLSSGWVKGLHRSKAYRFLHKPTIYNFTFFSLGETVMQPLIGISGRLVKDLGWCPPVIGHRQGYINAVIAAGGLPVVLPPTEDVATLRALYERMDGILLAGGEDINPVYYREDEHPQLGTVSEERDNAELPVARWAVEDGKPVLGICRGIQVLNVAMGGSLWQDILAQCPGAIDHEVAVREQRWRQTDHAMHLDEDSLLAEILGTHNIHVNSLHHQALKDIGRGLRVVGRAPDGVVEALESSDPDSFVVAVQCHPEELWQATDLRWRKLFQAFIVACNVGVLA